MKNRTQIFYLLALVLFVQCAQQAAPTGGNKDTSPPILDTNRAENTIPKNLSTNFNSSEITFYFNEYVKLNQPQKNIITTPEIKDFDYFLKGKKLVLTINETLRKNTTYTINLGAAIQDITEGNKMENFSYVFSTGNIIDSLSIEGRVIDAYQKIPVKDVTVLLYDAQEDSILYKKPLYYTSSNENGKYTFKYLKKGTFKLLAIEDANNNLKVDAGERMAFLDSTIVLDSSLKQIQLNLFTPITKKQFILERTLSSVGKISIALNKPTQSISIKTTPENSLIEYSTNNDSIEVWFDSIQLSDSKFLNVYISDLENNFEDSIQLPSRKNYDFRPLRFQSSFSKSQAFFKPIVLEANQPIRKIDRSKISLKLNEVPQEILVNDSLLKIFITLKDNSSFKQDELYELELLPHAIEGIYRTNDTSKWAVSTNEELNYGAINFRLSVPKNQYILELVNGQQTIETIAFNDSLIEYKFKELPVGSYRIRLITDSNNNGKWDTGNWELKTQPEPILYYNDPLNIRAGWDLDVSWQVIK